MNTSKIPTNAISLRDKLAQLMFVRIGSNMPPVRTVEEDAERIEKLLAECALGGLLLFNGRAESTPQTLGRLQQVSRYSLLVASDIERGIGQQLHGDTVFPHAMAFDALGDDAAEAVELFAYLTGTAARRSGIQIAFAPVADVNIDPRNPIIATRAFGTKPERVAELVEAYLRGSRRAGMLSTVKHFPGHGNTHDDSHHALPVVESSREELEACELVPFRTAIAAGVPLIMTAHVRYDALDSSGQPATLSRPILIDLLRNEMQFKGVIISDSLLMEGVKQQFTSEGDMAIATLEAGVDVLLDVAEPVKTLDALEAAVDQGRLSKERIEESFERLCRLKEMVSDAPTVVSGEERTATPADFSAEVARRAITRLSDEKQRLPFTPEKPLCAILVKPFTTPFDPPEQPLAAALREQFPNVTYFEFGPEFDLAAEEEALVAASASRQLLVAIIVKPAAWHHFGLLPDQESFVEQLSQMEDCVLVSLGSPEGLHSFPTAPATLTTYSDVAVSQVALAQALLTEPRAKI